MWRDRHFRRLFGALILSAIVAVNLDAQTRPDFVLENITVKAGEKNAGFVEVPKGIDEGTQIPVSIFHGKTGDSVLVVMAGVHGSEYAPILALQKIAAQINPNKLNGTIILIHIR